MIKGSVSEMNKLFDSLNMPQDVKQRCYDKVSSVAYKHPIIDMNELEDYIEQKFNDFSKENSLEDWLEKNHPEDVLKWRFFLGLDE